MSCDTAVAPPNPVTLINLGIIPYNITLRVLLVMRFANSAQMVWLIVTS